MSARPGSAREAHLQQSVITSVFLPIALAIVMLGLGLSLTIDDFKRVVVYPKAVIVGLVCQMLLLPLACFGVAKVFGLPPELAVGLMLLAASPGGATANLYSHLARGDVALNITLTAVNSVLSLATLPLIINASLDHFLGEGKSIPLQFGKVMQVVGVVLIPVAIGMVIRKKNAYFAEKLNKPVRITSALVLALAVIAAIVQEKANLVSSFKLVGLAALAFNIVSMAVGYFVPLAAKLGRRQAVAIGMEIGIHNGLLAITIASNEKLLNNPTMAIPPAIYSLIMFFTAAGFAAIAARTTGKEP